MSPKITIRNAESSDHSDYARLMPELGAHDPIVPQATWEKEQMGETLIAEGEGKVVGYVWGNMLNTTGYVRHLVTAPKARRMGVGRTLMDRIRRRFLDDGATHWVLSVKVENEPAKALYSSCGMTMSHFMAVVRWEGREAIQGFSREIEQHRPHQWPVRDLDEEDDEELERYFNMPGGLLASNRGRSLAVLRTLDTPASKGRAAVVMHPSFAGCFPFRVHPKEAAWDLLAEVMPYVPPEAESFQCVVEDHEELAQMLLERGGARIMDLAYFRGPIPPNPFSER